MERRKQNRKSPPDWHGVTLARQGSRERFFGTVKDLSPNGVGISAGINCRPGTVLKLKLVLFEEEMQECTLVGDVKWCDADSMFEGNYHLGIQTRVPLPAAAIRF